MCFPSPSLNSKVTLECLTRWRRAGADWFLQEYNTTLLEKAIKSQIRGRLVLSFAQWRCVASAVRSELRVVEAVLMKMCQVYEVRLAVWGFRAWRCWWEEGKGRQDCMRGIVAHMRGGAMGDVWTVWRGVAEERRISQIASERLVNRVKAIVGLRRARWAALRWQKWAREGGCLHEMMLKGRLQGEMKELGGVMGRWQEWYADMRSRQDMMRRTVGHLRHHSLGTVWGKWRHVAKEARRERRLMRVEQMRKWELRQDLGRWRDCTARAQCDARICQSLSLGLSLSPFGS